MTERRLQPRQWSLPIGRGLPNEDTPRTPCEIGPTGPASVAYLLRAWRWLGLSIQSAKIGVPSFRASQWTLASPGKDL